MVRCRAALTAWCGAVLHFPSPRRTVLRSAAQCSALPWLLHGAVPCIVMLCSAVYGTALHHSTLQRNALRSTVQHGAAL
jgi:hypothetical protein